MRNRYNQLKQSLVKLLITLKIFDPDGTFSHTSLLMMVAIIRLAFYPADAYSIGILTLALTHANVKKHLAKTKASKEVDDVAKLKALEEEVKKLISLNSMKNLNGRQ